MTVLLGECHLYTKLCDTCTDFMCIWEDSPQMMAMCISERSKVTEIEQRNHVLNMNYIYVYIYI